MYLDVATIAVGLLVVAVVVLARAFAGVSRRRVERFARRQRLVVTAANAPAVIGYLATTRRWRGAGLLVGVVAVAERSILTGSGLRIDLVAAFLGWFGGALVAEWRIGARRTDGATTRRAALVPRALARYVPPAGRILAAVAGVLLGGVIVVVAVSAPATGSGSRIAWQVGISALVLVLVALAGRRVLRRPQPAGPPDVLAADEAIRARSLCVLTGSTIAICGYLVAWLAATLQSPDVAVFLDGSARPAVAFGELVLPMLGAITAFAVARQTPQPSPAYPVRAGGTT